MAIILQGHTDRYDIDNYLSEHDFVYWSAPSLLKEMEIGTPVFLWRAGRQAGVVAFGRVAELPRETAKVQRLDDLGEEFWKKGKDSPSSMAVGIAIEDVRLTPDEGMLLRSDLKTDDNFMNSKIIKAPQGTVFKLTEKEYEYLSKLWQKARHYRQPKNQYMDFGDAPNDDPNELQQFAARVRRGQPAFRGNLMAAYGSRCVISNHGPSDVLEAVHILPHAKSGINELDNGLLMRADLHYLFDAGLIKINPESLELVVDSSLQGTPYMDFNGRKIRHRENGTHPSTKYLKQRWENDGV